VKQAVNTNKSMNHKTGIHELYIIKKQSFLNHSHQAFFAGVSSGSARTFKS